MRTTMSNLAKGFPRKIFGLLQLALIFSLLTLLFLIPASAAGNAPVVADIPDQTIDEGGSFAAIHLDDYVSDPDNDKAQLIWSVTGNKYLKVTTKNRVATITTPDKYWNGSETITFTATDPDNNFAQVSVTFTVNSINDPPTVYDIPNQRVRGSFDPIRLDDYVKDPDHPKNQLTWSFRGNTDLIIDLNNTTRILTIRVPYDGWAGSERITFTATDPEGLSDEKSATFIRYINNAPVANADSYTMNENTVLSISLSDGVLKNDTDADNDTRTVTLVNTTSNGSLTLNPGGSFTYTPNVNWSGIDTFTYKVYDGWEYSNVATVTITVNAVNAAPVAVNDNYVIDEDAMLSVDAPIGVLSNDADADGDTLTVTLVNTTNNGSLNLNPNGSFIYTPNANWNGTDTFTYKAFDGTAFSNVATVTIMVIPVNDAPVAVSDNYTINEDTVLTATAANGVLSNDTDADGDTLTATLVSTTANGTLALNPNGSFTYTPNANWNGTDAFTYKVSDGTAASNTATVTITVIPVNDPPVLDYIGPKSVNEHSRLTFTVTASDVDLPAQPLTFSLIGNVPSGASINPVTGVFSWTPNESQGGAVYTFTVQVSDGSRTDSETITVTVIETYTITWKNADGTLLEQDLNIPYGTMPSYNGATPAKAPTANYTYYFKGWFPTLTAVTKDITYTAQFTRKARSNTPQADNDIRSFMDEIAKNEAVLFSEIHAEQAEDWPMFTPLDISQDGEYTIPLVTSDMYVVGEVKVVVKEGILTVTYTLLPGVTLENEFLTIFTDLDKVTTIDPEELQEQALAFGEPVSLETVSAGNTVIFLYVRNVVDFNDGIPGLERLMPTQEV